MCWFENKKPKVPFYQMVKCHTKTEYKEPATRCHSTMKCKESAPFSGCTENQKTCNVKGK